MAIEYLQVGLQLSSAPDVTRPAMEAPTQRVGMTDVHLYMCKYIANTMVHVMLH